MIAPERSPGIESTEPPPHPREQPTSSDGTVQECLFAVIIAWVRP